jgi:hypothetical protein
MTLKGTLIVVGMALYFALAVYGYVLLDKFLG